MDKRMLWLVTLFMSITNCYAKPASQPMFMPQNLTIQDEQTARNHKWADLPWTGNNTPYQKVQQEMEAANAAGHDMEPLRVKYGLLAQQNPKDPVAQFRWAYAL